MAPPKFSTRVAAFHVDALVFSVVYELIHISLLRRSPEGLSDLLMAVIFVAATFVTMVLPTKVWGQTLGKKLYGLKVLRADRSAAPLNWPQAFQREMILKTISSVLLGFGFWRARRDLEGRAWHDSLAKTVVVSLRDESSVSLRTKLLETGVSLLTILAGVGLTVVAFAYTSLPLPYLQDQLTAAGFRVQSLSGSLGGGLHIGELSGKAVHLRHVELKADLVSSWQKKAVILESVVIGGGELEVDEGFAWTDLAQNVLADLAQRSVDPNSVDSESELDVQPVIPALHLFINQVEIRDFSLRHGSLVQGHLEEFGLAKLTVENGLVRATRVHSRSRGFVWNGEDFEYSTGLLKAGSVKGVVTPDLVPVLEKNLDFDLRGQISTVGSPAALASPASPTGAVAEADPTSKKGTRVEGHFFGQTGRFSWDQKKFSLTAQNTALSELVKSRLPIRNVSLQIQSEGSDLATLLQAATSTSDAEMCGHKGLRISAKSLPTLGHDVFIEKDAIENLFNFTGPSGGLVTTENLAVFCGDAAVATGLPMQPAPAPLGTKALTASGEGSRGQIQKAGSLLRSGLVKEALAEIEKIQAKDLTASELASFQNLKGWVYYSNQKYSEAAGFFTLAHSNRADVSDLEGLIRCEQKAGSPNLAQISAWTGELKLAVQMNPAVSQRLTANFRRQLQL